MNTFKMKKSLKTLTKRKDLPPKSRVQRNCQTSKWQRYGLQSWFCLLSHFQIELMFTHCSCRDLSLNIVMKYIIVFVERKNLVLLNILNTENFKFSMSADKILAHNMLSF